MSIVTLTIGPKNYPITCADGQEDHITALGAMIAEKYAEIGAARAPLEAQNLLFAALFLADELAEARKQAPESKAELAVGTGEIEALRATIARLEAELEAVPPAPAPASSTPQADDLFDGRDLSALMADRLEALADRAEASAAALEAVTANA